MKQPEKILSRLRTPHKANRLLVAPSWKAGDFDSHAVDCPFVFNWRDGYAMTYIGWDGHGYQTGLATSPDLIHWEKQGLILRRGKPGSLTEHNIALTTLLRSNDLAAPVTLQQVNGLYLGSWHAYPGSGYEVGPAVIGLCWSPDLLHWEIGEPILRPDPALAWEAGGLYKSWLVRHANRYYLFYNAKNLTSGPWHEQTGVAVSDDLVNWEKHPANPILRNGPAGAFDEQFVSDPCVTRLGGLWCLAYFGLSRDGHARDGVAFSEDLLRWQKGDEILLDIGHPGSIDSTHAHKPLLIMQGDRLFHFYCAVSPLPGGRRGTILNPEARGISAASNQPF